MNCCLTKKGQINGCFEFTYFSHSDQRGTFNKVYHRPSWEKMGITEDFVEDYFSFSEVGVFRGFHFQLPPQAHVKVVYCLQGEIDDYALDLRKDSSTFGLVEKFTLSAEASNAVYLPVGVAHGFHVPRVRALVGYKVSSVHHPDFDAGVHVASVLPDLFNRGLILSKRDAGLPNSNDFRTPFLR